MESFSEIIIDTHCHIFAEEFKHDRDEAIFRARHAGVKKILMPNIDLESVQALKDTHEEYLDLCLPMMGLHPCSVKENYREQLDKIHTYLEDGHYVGVGEIGLDYYWDMTFAEQQREAFREQLRWAKLYKKPVVIHTRNSFEDALKIVQEEKDENLTGVFHCFSGTAEDAQKVIETGFYMGIGGVVTFKNGGLDKVLPDIPLDYLLLETDSPYLSPVPYRGKRNEPSYLTLIAQKMAEIKGIPVEEIKEQTTENAVKLFGLKIKA
jgi:TatD DNase family protein